ncbi:lytic transglycosylase domain-containing protein [Streptomyces sp. NPDC002004]
MAAHFGRRIAKGAATTAVAAAAVAALSASQAPGVTNDAHTGQSAAEATEPPGGETPVTGNSPYFTDLPPLHSPTATPPVTGDTPVGAGEAQAGIPATVLDAYKKAEAALAESNPGCRLPWQLLAAIGKVESGQARGGRVDANGTTLSPILGPVLDGNGFASIKDTDGGRYDGDTTHDRAVGPMQFIPSTWSQGGPGHQGWGADGNGDGLKDPNNVYDAALAAGRYLCAGGRDLSVDAHLHRAILGYNHSQEYLNTVLSWFEFYRRGTHEVPDGTGSLPGERSDHGRGHRSKPGHSPSEPKTPRPGKHHKPSKPGGSHPTPSPDPDPKPGGHDTPKPTPPQTPTDTVARLADAGTGDLGATAGDAFARHVKVRTETAKSRPVAKVRVRFTIVGDTDATFTGGEDVATTVTDSAGTATAPTLQAGEKTGDFTVRATVVGRSLPGLDHIAKVTARQADALARTSDKELTCTPGGEFADAVEVKATYKGAVAKGVAATATLIKTEDDPSANDASKGDDPSRNDPVENDKGPYFKDGDGKPIRTLKDLETDENGLLKLPKLYADDATGTFLLRIDTTGGATLTVELKVEAAPPAQ